MGFFNFFKPKIFVIPFFSKKKVPDNREIVSNIEVDYRGRIKKAILYVNGEGDYPDDLLITLLKDRKIIFTHRLRGFEWAFNIEKDLSDILKGAFLDGEWTLRIEDCAEEDENFVNEAVLVFVVV